MVVEGSLPRARTSEVLRMMSRRWRCVARLRRLPGMAVAGLWRGCRQLLAGPELGIVIFGVGGEVDLVP